MVTPFSLPISAVRFSHSTASNGAVFPSVKYRLNTSPVFSPVVFCELTPVCSDLPFNAVFTVAIYSSALQGSPEWWRSPFIILLRFSGGAARSPMAAATCFAGSWGSKQKIRPHLAVERGRKRMQSATPCRGLVLLLPRSLHSSASNALHAGAKLDPRARFFCLEPGWCRGRADSR